jgi:hypothetical protein
MTRNKVIARIVETFGDRWDTFIITYRDGYTKQITGLSHLTERPRIDKAWHRGAITVRVNPRPEVPTTYHLNETTWEWEAQS